jgi:hypothetical protein
MFEIVGPIRGVEEIASGSSIRVRKRLDRTYGKGRWRKLKGIARIRIGSRTLTAEVHWYEAHGIGKREFKVKRIIHKE